MRDYDSTGIRNVALVGHAASGKTTLVDALAFAAGTSRRHGSIRDGTALTDSSPEATDRGYSTTLGCAFAEWQDAKINFIDTPGFPDFMGDAIAGLAAADGAVLCVSAAHGVDTGTVTMFEEAIARRDPVMVVVTMLDKEHADFDVTYTQLKARLGPAVVPVEVPVGAGPAIRGVMNLFTQRAYLYQQGGKAGEYVETDIPDDARAAFDRYRAEMLEAIAATDDALLERYLDGTELGRDEVIEGLKAAMKRDALHPVFAVSAERLIGVRALLTELVQLMPSAWECEELHGWTGSEGDRTVTLHATDDGPFAALVFKTQAEPHVGQISYLRVLSGSVEAGADVFNATRDAAERMANLAAPLGRERVEVLRVRAGDICTVAKLRNTHTGDTLSTRAHPIRLPALALPEPVVHFAVRATSRNDEEKLQVGLHALHDEDPTLEVHLDAETHETILSGLGERHVEVALARLKRKFGVGAELAAPRIAWREALFGTASARGRHKKQSGGRGQFGDAHVTISPLPRGEGYVFVDSVVGGAIPGKYIPAVDAGIREAAQRGVLAGAPVVDFRAELTDGSFHSVDSSELAFKLAGILAFKAAAAQCRPALLEPVDQLELEVPTAHLGDVMGDLSARRGQILGTDAGGAGKTIVRALVPRAELHLYATHLRGLTHGDCRYRARPAGYEVAPPDVTARVVREAEQGDREAHHPH